MERHQYFASSCNERQEKSGSAEEGGQERRKMEERRRKKEVKEAQMEVGVEGHRPFRSNNMV